MDKRKITAYKEAIAYVQKNVLHSNLFEKDTATIAHAIKTTNKIATKYLNLVPGQLRDQMKLILNINTVTNREGLERLVRDEGGSKKDIEIFHGMYNKLEKYHTLNKALPFSNPEELRIMNKIGYLSCPPHEIENRLVQVAAEIKAL